jgi:hypothetical protein
VLSTSTICSIWASSAGNPLPARQNVLEVKYLHAHKWDRGHDEEGSSTLTYCL